MNSWISPQYRQNNNNNNSEIRMGLDISTEHWILKDHGAFSHNFGTNNFQGELLFLANYQSSTRSHCKFEYLKSYFLTTHLGCNTSQEASGECMPRDKGVGQKGKDGIGNRKSRK